MSYEKCTICSSILPTNEVLSLYVIARGVKNGKHNQAYGQFVLGKVCKSCWENKQEEIKQKTVESYATIG